MQAQESAFEQSHLLNTGAKIKEFPFATINS